MIPFKKLGTVVLVFVSFATFASGPGWEHTKEKKIDKQFSVASDATLEVVNKYGNVTISTWNQNRIEIVVTITTESNSEKRAQEKLDEIRVDFQSSTGKVSAKTVIERSYSNWNWGWSDSNVSVKINYQIRMPVTNFLILNNDYGAVVIDQLDAKAIIDCDYGSMDIGRLNASDNQLSFDYTKRVVIDYVKSATINADYSGFRIEQAGSLSINADYTGSEVNKADWVKFSADYGSFKVNEAQEIYGNGDYLSIELGKVLRILELNADYGSLRIRSIEPGFELVKINSNYASINAGLHPDTRFQIEAKLSYANFKAPESIDYSRKIIQGSSKSYTGTYGVNPSGKIILNSDYGGVTLTQN